MSALDVRFRVPQARRALVDRTRLRQRLDAGFEYPPRLLLVAAPAGFGKTTLLTQWLISRADSHSPPTVAWMPVESSDTDVVRFVTNLATAVEQATGTVGTLTRTMLSADHPPPALDALAVLVNDLDDVADDLVIALDDYHLAASLDVDEAIGFLLENLPPRATLAMTTRSDPALPLARLRSRGELLEIRATDLRFTTEEADAFLSQVMGLHLHAGQVAALGARTEGWAAGLQLAALSARARADGTPQAVDAFIDEFTGSNRFVLDYLLEEVLNGEDDATHRFLLQTSVLDRLSGPLCGAVTGKADGQQTLESLESRNLFVVPLDDTRGWYRYHQLFADALRARLLAEHPDAVAPLHHAAAAWYAGQGQLADAVRHASAADDPCLVADLVEADLPTLRKHRQDRTIITRLEAVADDQLRARPLLATCKAWAHLAHSNLDDVVRWLAIAEQASAGRPQQLATAVPNAIRRARDDEVRIVPATIAIYRAALAQAHGDAAGTVVHAARAKHLAGPDDHLVHAAAVGFLGLADWSNGNVRRAREMFEETRSHLDAAGNVADALSTTVPVAAMTVAQGEPDRARQAFLSAIATAQAHTGPVLASHADLHVGLADLLRERNDLSAAAHHLEIAEGLGDMASLPENRFRPYVVSSDLLAATGNFEAALTALDNADERYLPGFFPDLQPLAARRARLLIRAGRLDGARAWADESRVGLGDDVSYRSEYDHLTLVRLRLAEGPSAAAGCVDLLDRLLVAAEDAGRTGSTIETLVIRAHVHGRLGDHQRALKDLAAAVTLGVPAGYRRLFLDEGEPGERLLRRALSDGDLAAIHEAIRELLGTPAGPPPVLPLQLAAEPLSARELEVLHLLGSTLTGPEIARELYISLNTFRTHTKRIFVKLDVKTRRAAVARAAGLGI